MLEAIVACILIEHDPFFTGLAVFILTAGSLTTMRLFARVRRTDGSIKGLWLLLSGLVGGGTIWSTHFVSMLAYKSPFITGYDLNLTALSLLIAVAASALAFFISAITQKSILIETGGLLLGLGIAAMHYVGIEAVMLEGDIAWQSEYVLVSLVLAGIFGILAANRIARPVTRFCKYGGALGFILAVASLHFTSMAGMDLIPDLSNGALGKSVSIDTLGYTILFVMVLVMTTALVAYTLDHKNSQNTDAHIKRLALHDTLTGLPNRVSAEQYVSSLIDRGIDDTASIAVAVIDINRFKQINDTHGHSAADTVLCRLAEKLNASIGNGEFIARFGGDEFVAIKYPVYSAKEARAFCERLLAVVNEPFMLSGTELLITGSSGYSLYPTHSKNPSDLIEKADMAMYRAKSAGKNIILSYDRNIDEPNRDKSALFLDLSKALENDQFEIDYQLQNHTKSGAISGVEALLRWAHPERGRISPGIFIPLAEETGLINSIGDWVLRKACEDATKFARPIKVAVNVATSQLNEAGFPEKVKHILRETGLAPNRLELEITESGIIQDRLHAQSVLNALKKIGVRIAMDDFGTGYSSLSTLQNFPFDKIKIDREFIMGVPDSKHSAAIVKATIILADSVGMTVLAEGVETEAHRKFLTSEGCPEVQGFYFGRPMPIDELQARLSEESAAVEDNVISLTAPRYQA